MCKIFKRRKEQEQNMKAIVMTEAGSVENLEERQVDKPEIKNDEVLIEVKATALNPIDTLFRKGKIPVAGDFPTILLSDIAGDIVEVGSDVSEFQKGEAVFTRNDMEAGGGLGEYVAVSAQDVVVKPEGVSYEEAATLGCAALTAYQSVNDSAHVSSGDAVFINGANGGVGHFVVQFAKMNGAQVTATTSSQPDFLIELGADNVVNYKEEDATETRPKEYDILIDMAGNGTDMLAVVKDGGFATTPAREIDSEKAAERDIETERISHDLDTGQMTQFAQMVKDGKLDAHLHQTFPRTVKGVQEAFNTLENGGLQGKVVISTDI